MSATQDATQDSPISWVGRGSLSKTTQDKMVLGSFDPRGNPRPSQGGRAAIPTHGTAQ